MAISLKLVWGALVCLFLVLSACGSDTSSPASDPPGALVRLQRNSSATTLPGDLTVFSNGGLQLYFDDRGALRKTVAPADLAGLQAALTDPALSSRIIDAPIDAVFDAYANPEKLVRWWGPNGFMLDTESLDLHEGGHWRFVFTGPDGTTYKNHLVFQNIERPHLFVVDHLSGPKYHGAVTFDDVSNTTRVTMYWTYVVFAWKK